MNNIFVSTGGFNNRPAIDTIKEFNQFGIRSIELSGGLFSPNQLDDIILLSKQCKFHIHNYFPPAEIPFVFNLATSDSRLLKRSMDHVRNAIEIASEIGSLVYSFHAGFKINPKVSELGHVLSKSTLRDHKSAFDQFVDCVLILAEEANVKGVSLLIENNVLSQFNLDKFSKNPLLLTSPDEICLFMSKMPENVGILLDVAHLKVSGNSLGFNIFEAHESIKPWIKAYHLSDNCGKEDSNQVVRENSWFWEVIIPTLNYYTIEVYNLSIDKLIDQYNLVDTKLRELKNEYQN